MTPGHRDFHNRLRILLNIGMIELERAGVIEPGDRAEWDRFRESPWRWFIACSDEQAEALWALMNSRSTRHASYDEMIELLPELLRDSITHYGNPTDESYGVGLLHAKARAQIAKAAS